MEGLASTVKQSADNARQANELALAAFDMAFWGGAVVASEVRNLAQRDGGQRDGMSCHDKS